MIGEVLGHYRVISVLGQGGMGIVYEGEHALIRRKVAIKVLLPERSQNNEIVQRFFNEARASTLIHHPGIVDIIDFGYHASGLAYIVMEFLEGESLARHLAHVRKIPPELALPVLRQLASALSAAHRKGIVHRDLKPDNIFLVPDPDVISGVRVKVLDFGIAKLVDTDLRNSLRTRTGSLMGTPLYMSPEQCRGAGSVDHRSDIYALGCIAYEMLCGRPPFYGEGMGDFIVAHISVAPTPVRTLNADVPEALEALVMHMLGKTPEARPQSMDEVVAVLDSLGGLPPVRFSRPMTSPLANQVAPPSTLGGSASQVASVVGPAAPRWRAGIIAAVGTALGIGIGVYAVGRGPSTTQAGASANQTHEAPPPPTPPAAKNEAEPPVSPPAQAEAAKVSPGPAQHGTPTVPDAGPTEHNALNTEPATESSAGGGTKTPPQPAGAKKERTDTGKRAGRQDMGNKVIKEPEKKTESVGDNPVDPFEKKK